MSRLDDLIRFYELLDRLEAQIGGKRKLDTCTGSMQWPKRGVYFFFEDGELRSGSGEGPRVVRIGTHALKAGGKTSIWNRLSQHRGPLKTGGGNHRGSIFRLHVGTALKKREHWTEDAAEEWGIGSSRGRAVRDRERPLEVAVSKHIRQMPFLWLCVNDEPGPGCMRGWIERNAIGLLSGFHEVIDPPSTGWLGHWADREDIRCSGLWNVNHVREGYDPEFLRDLEELIFEIE
jgi:hypothetical protein